MRIAVLHSADAIESPEDPVLKDVESALAALDHDVTRVCADNDVVAIAQALRRAQPDLAFNLTESFGGVSSLDSNVAALLNLLDLRYTGSSPSGLMLSGDKSLAKKVLGFHGIRTPTFATVYRGAVDWAGNIAFPVIVKPPQEDASIGITGRSVVSNLQDLLGRIDELQSEFTQPVLIEEYIEGREFYVGMLGNAEPEPLPVMELDFSRLPAGTARVATWEAKWGVDGTGTDAEADKSAEFAGTRSVFPTDVDETQLERMQAVAGQVFDALRLRDYARIDLRVNASGEIFVIEVNPNCYLERNAEFARAAERGGYSYHALIARIVDLARARYAR